MKTPSDTKVIRRITTIIVMITIILIIMIITIMITIITIITRVPSCELHDREIAHALPNQRRLRRFGV